MGVFTKILFEPAPRLRELRPDLPPALDELVDAMLAKDTAQRVQHAAEVVERLARIGPLTEASTPPVQRRSLALTRHELRLLCLCVVSPYSRAAAMASTQSGEEQFELLGKLRGAAAPFGARIEPLPDGTILLLLEGSASAAEQAELAAYCALAVRSVLPAVPIALCLGHSDLGAELLDARAVERAAGMLDRYARRRATAEPVAVLQAPILIDEGLRRLLEHRFVCTADGTLTVLSAKMSAPSLPKLDQQTPFAGRDLELTRLHSAAQWCLAESVATVLLVTAELGMGKSRLCQEFLAQLRSKSPEMAVWVGRADPSSAGSPFALIAQTVRRAVQILDDEPAPARTAKLRARIKQRVAAADQQRVVEFMGELLNIQVPPPASPQLLAARRDPVLMGDQIRRAFCDFLAAECRAQPLLLVLEDLHWGDYPTVHLVDAALRALADQPFLVVALARPQIHELFPRLWEARSPQEVRLTQLGRKASERIVRTLLGPTVPDAQVAVLVERAAGNPFFLEELVHAAAEGQLMAAAPEVPDSVLALLQARILRVETAARKVLRAASVFGQAFWPGGVATLLGVAAEEAELLRALEILLRRDLISLRASSRFQREPEYCFRHALVRDAAYSMLTEHDRRLGHRLAADFLQVAGESDALVLAEHLERGSEPERALTYYRRAVRDALEGNDFAAALTYAERAITGGARGEALGELRALQAEAHQWRGEYEQAHERALIALSHLPRGSVGWLRAATASAIAAGRRLDHAQLMSLGEELLAIGRAGERSDAYVAAGVRVGLQLYVSGQYEPSRVLLGHIEDVATAAQGERTPAVEAMLCVVRGNRAAYEWQLDRCADLYERSAELFQEAGDLRSAASQWLDAAIFCSDFAAFARMERLLRLTIRIAERLGLVRLQAVSNNALAHALWRLNRLDEALALGDRARAELLALPDLRVGGICCINLARIHRLRGDLAAAQSSAEEAMRLLATSPRHLARAAAVLAQIHLTRGEPAAARSLAAQGMALLTALGRIGTDEGLVRLAEVQVLLAEGDRAAARAAIAIARERLLAQAALIISPAHQQDFLRDLHENAEIMRLAAELCPSPDPL